MIKDMTVYDGMELDNLTYIPDKSFYCHNYYRGLNEDLIYVWSDDDNYSEISLVVIDKNGREKKIEFAECFCTGGDIIHVFADTIEIGDN
jgi:hypothetical protein